MTHTGFSHIKLAQLVHSFQTLLQLCDQIGVLSSLLTLSIDNSLRGTGNKLLVRELGIQRVQELLGSFQLLGDAGDFLGNIHQLTHGNKQLGVGSGDGHHLHR